MTKYRVIELSATEFRVQIKIHWWSIWTDNNTWRTLTSARHSINTMKRIDQGPIIAWSD